MENARIGRVSDRVEVREGNARQLPFTDNSFDVVVSNFVLHEMDTQSDREEMTREIVRFHFHQRMHCGHSENSD